MDTTVPSSIGYWNQRKYPSILFITYEDMKRDLPSVIKIVANFLDKDFSETDISELANHLSFQNMKHNAAVNKEDVLETMRKGETGDWRNHLTEKQLEMMKGWERKQLEGSDLQFTYDL